MLSSIHTGSAQSQLDTSSLIGKWELFSINGDETTIPRENMEVTANTIEILDNCNNASFTYSIENEEMKATPPDMRTLMACGDKTMQLNQEVIVAAITNSKVQLSGGVLELTPLTRTKGLLFLKKLEFRRQN